MVYTWPLPDGTPVSQHFGANPNNGVNPSGGHTGTDFAVPVGTPVRAIGDGVVKFADWASTLPADYRPDGSGPNPYWLAPGFGGIVVVIDHGPVVTVHAHLSKTSLNAGDKVRQGQVIALSGDTGGATTGPHLHFETLPDGWDFQNGTYGRVAPETFCTGYWSAVNPDSNNVTPITPAAPIQEDPMFLAKLADSDAVYISNGVTYRHVVNGPSIDALVSAGVVPNGTVITVADLDVLGINADILHTSFARQGDGMTGDVDAGGVIANFDSAVRTLDSHIQAISAASGSSPADLVAAIKAQWAK